MIRSYSILFIKPTEYGLLNLIEVKSHNCAQLEQNIQHYCTSSEVIEFQYYEIRIISEYQKCDLQYSTHFTFNHPVVIKSDKMNHNVALTKSDDIQKMMTFLQESYKFAGELTVNNETEALERTTSNLENAKSTKM
ncbi:hypothetical protein KSF78_0004390 [Schistosoma japonicum]|nr:hypothetical protein KSF78_0004390 [Schistosoma japonicum]